MTTHTAASCIYKNINSWQYIQLKSIEEQRLRYHSFFSRDINEMNYHDARRKSWFLMIFGLSAALLGGGLSVIAFLKSIYYRLDTGTELSRAVATPFKNMVVELVNLVHMPGWLWKLAPTPDPQNFLSTDNYSFGVCYIIFIGGSLVFGAGLKIKRKLDEIDQEIEKEILKASVEGRPQRSKAIIKESLNVPQGSYLSGMHKYYIAPLIVLVFGSLFLKWIGVI